MTATKTAVKDGPSTKVITGLVRLSYCHIWEPAAVETDGEKKYSVALLIPKSDTKTIDKINKAVELATELGKTTKFGGKIPSNLKLPLRDGDEEKGEDETYEGCYFLNANAKTKPGIVDAQANPILDQDEVYSGCYGIASVTFFAFAGKSKGIACGLNHIMKIKDGAPLGGRASAENDFAELIGTGAIDELDDDDIM